MQPPSGMPLGSSPTQEKDAQKMHKFAELAPLKMSHNPLRHKQYYAKLASFVQFTSTSRSPVSRMGVTGAPERTKDPTPSPSRQSKPFRLFFPFGFVR